MSSDIQRVGDLEISQDHPFQYRSWAVQRYAWAGMGLVVLLGLLGLFGPGPLSDASAGDPGGALHLEYHRFGRARCPMMLMVDLTPGRGHDAEARLWLGRDYLAALQIQRVDPVPVRVEAGPERSAYVFRLVDPARPTRVTFHLRPDRMGRLRARVSLDNGPPLDFTQFIYP